MRWILDDGPFDHLADEANLERLVDSYRGRLIVAPSTARGALPSSARTRLLNARLTNGKPLVQVFELLLSKDDPAAEIFLELHGQEKTTTNRAEMEAIAWILVHAADGVFVTADRRAALTALAELGRTRVAHPFDLWIELLNGDALTPEEFRALCNRTRQKDQGLVRMPGRVQNHLP